MLALLTSADRYQQPAIPLPFRPLDSPDFSNLRFDIYHTSKIYLAYHQTSNALDKKQQWPELCFEVGWEKYYSDDYDESGWQTLPDGPIINLAPLALHPAACAMHYAPAAFEGTKAMLSAKGKIVLFRPEMNARRLLRTAARLLLPQISLNMFVDAIAQTVLANRDFIPPFCHENWQWETRNPMCLYVRPLLFGHGPELGVKSAKDHLFLIFTSPVKAFWPIEGVRVLITDSFHRAAPGGIGSGKAIGNYASGLLPSAMAKHGFDWHEGRPIKVSDQPFYDVLYLDAVHNKYVEEFAAANFVAITKDGTVVTPKSDSILSGNTCDAILQLAAAHGWRVESRPVSVDEVMDEHRIAEVFGTGNAAIITPVSELHFKGKSRYFTHFSKTQKLWDLLVGVQLQILDDPFGWVREIG